MVLPWLTCLLDELGFGDGGDDEFGAGLSLVEVAAVELVGGVELGVSHVDPGGEGAILDGDLAAAPGAKFVDGLLGGPALLPHPGADASKGVFGAFGGGASE